MGPENRIGPKIAGLLAMLVAAPVTLLSILTMNTPPPEPEKRKASTVIGRLEQRRKPPPPPRKVQPKKRVARKPSAAAKLPTLPSLASAIGGVAFGRDIRFRIDDASETLTREVLQTLDDDIVHTDATVDRKPRPRITDPEIAAPEAVRRKGIGGHVVVNLLIGIDGRVKAIKILESEPAGVFDMAVIQAVQQWIFDPAVYNSQAVETWATLPVRFDP